jgi:hypothetical protein
LKPPRLLQLAEEVPQEVRPLVPGLERHALGARRVLHVVQLQQHLQHRESGLALPGTKARTGSRRSTSPPTRGGAGAFGVALPPSGSGRGVDERKEGNSRRLGCEGSHGYQHGKTQNQLRESDLDLIEQTYHRRQDVDRCARLVSAADIAGNDFNLSVTRYVATADGEEEVDLDALRAERGQLKARLEQLEAKLAVLLEEAGRA